MGKSPSAVYTAEHTHGWKVDDLRIRNSVFEGAESGSEPLMLKLCLVVRDKIKDDLGRDPGFVAYGELTFTKIRDIPAAAKNPPLMRAASSLLKNAHSSALTRRK